MDEYKLSFNIKPQVKGRPRVTRWATYNPKKTQEFKDNFIPLVRIAWGENEILKSPLKVRIRFICKKPKQPAKAYPHGDIDNYAKAVYDCMNEIVWMDDVQIIHATETKEWGEIDRIDVTVKELSHPLTFE